MSLGWMVLPATEKGQNSGDAKQAFLSFLVCIIGAITPVKAALGKPQKEDCSSYPGTQEHFLLGATVTPVCSAADRMQVLSHIGTLPLRGTPSLDSTATSFLTSWQEAVVPDTEQRRRVS